ELRRHVGLVGVVARDRDRRGDAVEAVRTVAHDVNALLHGGSAAHHRRSRRTPEAAASRSSWPRSYTTHSPSTRANAVSACSLVERGPSACRTATPQATSASAISWAGP